MNTLLIIAIVLLIDLLFDGIILFLVYRSHKDKVVELTDEEYEEFQEWLSNREK